MIAFKCSGCAKNFSVKDDLAGRKTRCPKCGASMLVPAAKGAVAIARPAHPPSSATKNPFELPPDADGLAPVNENAQSPRRGSFGKTVLLGCGTLLGLLLIGSVVAIIVVRPWEGRGVGGGIIPGGGDAKIDGGNGPKGNAMEVTAEEIFNAYKANGVAADDKYKGKAIQIRDVVDSTNSNVSGAYVLLSAGFLCFFDDNHKGQLTKLRKGQYLTVRGVFEPSSGGFKAMKNCELVESKPMKLELSASEFSRELSGGDGTFAMAWYEGKTLQINGKIKEYRDDALVYREAGQWGNTSRVTVCLEGGEDRVVACLFNNADTGPLEKTSKGQLITVRGIYDRHRREGGDGLRECKLLK